MAKVDLVDVGNLANTLSARLNINENATRIEAGFENTLSRDGTAPNNMEADLDMDSNRLLNVADAVGESDGVNLRQVQLLLSDVQAGIDPGLRVDLAGTNGASLVNFLQQGTGAVMRSVLSKLRDVKSVFDWMTPAQIADVQARTALLDVTTPIQAALTAADAGLYFPAGLYKIAGNLTISNKSLTLFGDGSGLSVILQSTSGGLVYASSGAFNFNMPALNLKGLGLHSGAANSGNAVTINSTGGSGFAGVGMVWEDVEIVPHVAGQYWTKGVRGTNVRNARFARVVIGSNAITGQTTHGFHFDGNDDPVELWFDDFTYLYTLELGILIEGQYEGIYLNGINMTSVRDGLRWESPTPNPTLHVMNSYLNVQRVAVDTDRISYFKVQNNSFSSSGLSTGDFIGVQVRRTTGSQTQAGDISGNTFIGGNGYVENGVKIVSGSNINVHDNTFYTMTGKAIEFIAGSGLREYNNAFPASAAPQVTKPAGVSSVNQFPEVLLRADANSATQAVPVNVATKLNYPRAVIDNWNYYNTATSRWTPPVGTYRINAHAYFTTNIVSGDTLNLEIKKNGGGDRIATSTTAKAGVLAGQVNAVVVANGTDYFEIFATIEGTGSDRTKVATNQLNYFDAAPV